MGDLLSLNWVDDGTFVVAIGYALVRHFRRQPRKAFRSGATRKDFLDGTALFPLFVLSLSLFSDRLTQDLLHANKLILSVAGVVAILAVLEE